MPHVNYFLSLPVDLYAEFCEIARLRGMSLSDFVIESMIENAEAHLHDGNGKTTPPPPHQSNKEAAQFAPRRRPAHSGSNP